MITVIRTFSLTILGYTFDYPCEIKGETFDLKKSLFHLSNNLLKSLTFSRKTQFYFRGNTFKEVSNFISLF